MNAQQKDPETKTPANEIDNPAEAGKKAIEADKAINKQDKTDMQKQEEEKQDAEKWRSEG